MYRRTGLPSSDSTDIQGNNNVKDAILNHVRVSVTVVMPPRNPVSSPDSGGPRPVTFDDLIQATP